MRTNPAPRHLGFWQLWAYALPGLSIQMMIMPVAVIVPALYVKERGVGLAAMGVVLMAARIFDGFADQAVGFLSDATRRRWHGGRKLWLVLGALVAMPSVYMLCTPPGGAGLVWFTSWSLIAYLAWAMLLIPHTAWGSELSRDYGERTRIATARTVVGQVGGLGFLFTPIVLQWLGIVPTSEMTFDAAHFVAIVLLFAFPLTILPALLAVPRGVPQPRSAPVGIAAALRALVANRPAQIFLSTYLVGELGYGIVASVVFLYIDAYLGIGARFSEIIIVSTLATLAALPVWQYFTRRADKKRAMMLSFALQGAAMLAFVAVPQGPAGYIPALAIFTLMSMAQGGSIALAPSVLGDVIDYDTFRSSGYRAGNYFALYSLVNKVVVALGGGLALILLDFAGYSVTAPASNGAAANNAMVAIFAVIPALLRFASIGVLAFYPITARRQDVVRRALERREARIALSESAQGI